MGSRQAPSRAESERVFPRDWKTYLERYVWQYRHLRHERQRHLELVVAGMVERRRWTGGNQFSVTDEMRVAIAGQAGLMTLGLEDPYYFDHIPDIIVYEKPFFVTSQQATTWSADPTFGSSINSPRLGEAWHRGPIVLAWQSIVDPYGTDEGHRTSLVVHEFTHHLDGLDGDMSGTPPIASQDDLSEWYRVTEADYLKLAGRALREEDTLLSAYGATNRAEFFAVASECFFDQPHELRDQHPHLYEVLAKYFRQSPADYLPRAAQPPMRRSNRRNPQHRRKLTLDKAIETDAFSRGVAQYNDGKFEEAIGSFTAAITENPADGEAFYERAMCYLGLEDAQNAMADAQMAISMNADDSDARTVVACAHCLSGDYEQAVKELLELCGVADSALVRFYLGIAQLNQGDPKRAVHQFSLALADDEFDSRIYELRAQAYRELGDKSRAQRDESRARQLEPGEG